MYDLQTARSWLPVEYQGRVMRPYVMPGTYVGLAGGASTTITYTLQNVAAFLVVALVGRIYEAATPETPVSYPPFTLDFRFGSGDALTDSPAIWSGLVVSASDYNAGLGGLVAPRLISGGASLQAIIAHYGATTYSVKLDVHGWNVYNS